MNDRHANKKINKVAVKTMEEVVEIIDKYTRKFDRDIALLESYNILGLYDFTEHSAKMEEEIQEETTEMTEELMDILRKIPV